jgi:hypothetical protein
MRDRRSLLLGLTLSLSVLDCAGAPHVLYHNRLQSLDGILTRDGVSSTLRLRGEPRSGLNLMARLPSGWLRSRLKPQKRLY